MSPLLRPVFSVCLVSSLLVAFAGHAALAETNAIGIIDVGDRRQVFIDSRFMADVKDVRFRVHPPRKTGEWTIRPDRPWESGGIGTGACVLEIDGTYHLWYPAMADVQWDASKDAGSICYARSKDGITWEKPALGLTEYRGSRDNNIIFGQGAAGMKFGENGCVVFVDPNAPAEERLRMAFGYRPEGAGVHVYSSGDGIHWKLTHRSVLTARPEKTGHHLDSQNVILWDGRLHRYVAYVRKNLNEKNTQGRSVARGESDRLGGFPVVQDLPVVLGPKPGDPWVDYYTSGAIKYPWADDAYYLFPQTYFHYLGGATPEFPKETPINAGPLDTQFAASRDGIKFERYGREPFVRLGMKGEFDWATVRMIWGLVPDTGGREMYMYYRASDWLHGWDRNPKNKELLTGAGLGAGRSITVISRLVSRRDGFVSVHASYTGGEFTTQPLRFSGSRLVLNVDTSATGTVHVEIQDEAGKPIDGCTEADCDLIHTADEISRPVHWKGNADLSKLAGKPVRVRFVIRNADLYAFQFQNGACSIGE